MLKNYFILFSVFLFLTAQGCATQVEEPDMDQGVGTNSEDSGEKRSFDPCKLNDKLPVCNQSNL